MKRLIATSNATTVRELIEALTGLTPKTADVNIDSVYTTINSDSLRLFLIEETLSDGSKVYNIEFGEAKSRASIRTPD
jgi:hypothetical protein